MAIQICHISVRPIGNSGSGRFLARIVKESESVPDDPSMVLQSNQNPNFRQESRIDIP